MAHGNINLHIGSSFDDAGFKRLDRNVRGANKTIGKFGRSFGSVVSSANDVTSAMSEATNSAFQLGGSFGNVAKAAAPLLGGILSMGIWGALFGAVGLVVGVIKKLATSFQDSRLAAKGMSREFMTPEYQAQRYQERINALVGKHKELIAAMKESAALANEKDAADLSFYRTRVEYSMAVAENEAKTVAQIAEQAKIKREMAAIDARSARRNENRGFTAQQSSQNFEQESGWHIEAVTKMANAEIALAKAEADRAIAFERVEVAARTRALENATQHYGATSRAALAAQRDLIAAQEKMARTIEKSSASVEKSQKAAEDSIVRANVSAARQRAKNAAAMVAEARAEGKVAIEAARESGKEQIRAAEASVKIAKQRAVLAESDRERALATHDRKTARDVKVATFDVEEKENYLKAAKGRSRDKYGNDQRTSEVIKAETALAASQRNLDSITKRAAISRAKIAQDSDIKVSKAQMALVNATNALESARLNAAKIEKDVEQRNAETLAAVKRQARVLQELADYKSKEIQTARQAQKLNEKSVRNNAALDARIAAAKTAAAKWQEEMSRVHQRDGQGRQIDFNEFQRREKQRVREQKRDEARGRNIDNRAERERDQLQDRIFDRNGKLRKSANKQDIARWQELNKFIEMRRGNNPNQNAVDALEKQKAKNVESIAKNVAGIQKSLGQLGL